MRVKDAGLQPASGTGQPIDEPEVIPWIPAASVYFQDPDGHLLEYIAMLSESPAPQMKRMPLSKWRDMHSTQSVRGRDGHY
jgi:lactoylglutathione lyase